LVDVSLDNNTIVYASKWFNINVSESNIEYLPSNPIIGGKVNDKIFFINKSNSEDSEGFQFHDINWISDEQAGRIYIYVALQNSQNLLQSILGSSKSSPGIIVLFRFCQQVTKFFILVEEFLEVPEVLTIVNRCR
ncbi:11938_t:CDS:2, partial [Dentiscutata heterogama]